jgi:hypothetical protein
MARTHRLTGVLLVSLASFLAFSLLLAGPLAPSAAAYAVPSIAPLNVPGSVYGSYDAASALDRARAVGNVAPAGNLAVPPGAPVTVPGYQVVGGVVQAGAALMAGWQIGKMVCGTFEACAGTSPAATYVPNSDIPPDTQGWVPGASLTGTGVACKPPSCGNGDTASGPMSLSLTIPSAPWTYRANVNGSGGSGASVPVRVDWVWTPPEPAVANSMVAVAPQNVATFKCVATVGAAASSAISVASMGVGPASGAFSGNGNTNWSTNGCSSTAQFFDRVEITKSGVLQATWYPTGHPSRPSSVSDPDRKFRTTFKCDDGSGLTTHVVSSATYRESVTPWPAWPDAVCTGSGLLDYMKVETVPVIPGQVPERLLSEWQRTQATKDWQTVHPTCGDGHCKLVLWRKDQGTARLSCFAQPELCTEWYESPTKAAEFECTYGGTVVALSECNAYRRVFDPARSVTSTGKPNTADPVTGTPIEASTPAGEPDPAQDSSCPPSFGLTSALNPFWYYKMTVCALDYVFVPQSDIAAQVSGVAGNFTSRAPVSWLDEGSAFGRQMVPVGAGACPDWVVHVGSFSQNVVCGSSYTNAIRDLRPVFTAMMLLTAFAPLMRSLWYAVLPVVRPVPTSGGS